jgi:hypothetical protein
MKANEGDSMAKLWMKKIFPPEKFYFKESSNPALGNPWETQFQQDEGSTKIGRGWMKRKGSKTDDINENAHDFDIGETTVQEQRPFLGEGLHSISSKNIHHFSTQRSLKFPLQYDESPQHPFQMLQTNATIATTNIVHLMSLRSKVETLFMVGVIVGLFGLAMFCFACSMSGRDVWQKCCVCCCFCCNKKNRPSETVEDTDEQSQSPTSCCYTTVQQFVFDAEHDTAPAIVVNAPTTIDQLFPDLLASSTNDLEALLSSGDRRRRRRLQRRAQTNNCDNEEEYIGHTAQLSEPLL